MKRETKSNKADISESGVASTPNPADPVDPNVGPTLHASEVTDAAPSDVTDDRSEKPPFSFIGLTPEQIILVMAAISKQYDSATHKALPSPSDTTISTELGVPVDAVAYMRQSFFTSIESNEKTQRISALIDHYNRLARELDITSSDPLSSDENWGTLFLELRKVAFLIQAEAKQLSKALS